MPDRMIVPPERERRWWVLLIVLTACIVILAIFRLQGLLLLLPVAAIATLVMSRSPDASEARALRSSIVLSAEDIRDVIDEYDAFATGTDAALIADRTLSRPALLDQDCADADIAAFHHECATARRFLHRLEARLTKEDLDIGQLEALLAVTDTRALDIGQLEALLAVTDTRALDIRETWLAARQAALRLGPDY